jgi:hypothetical protein
MMLSPSLMTIATLWLAVPSSPHDPLNFADSVVCTSSQAFDFLRFHASANAESLWFLELKFSFEK